jgi:large subunit ribosomal protein L25
MANAALKAEPRSATGKGANRKIRATGRIPAVVYGHGDETRALTLDSHELDRLLSQVNVGNTIIDLTVAGEPATVKTLVREIQRHAYRDDILHIDFYQIHAGERITVSIPLRLVGAAPGVKAGGMLQHALTDLDIRCFPDRIPESIDVDISQLEIGDTVHAGELILPEGVESLIPADRSVCSVLPPAVVAVEVPAEVVAEEAVAEPEVITRRKEEPTET